MYSSPGPLRDLSKDVVRMKYTLAKMDPNFHFWMFLEVRTEMRTDILHFDIE